MPIRGERSRAPFGARALALNSLRNTNLTEMAGRRRPLLLTWQNKRRKKDHGSLVWRSISYKKLLIIALVMIAIAPPIYFHFKLGNLHKVQKRRCRWLTNPPLVCAHGGDSSTSFPNSMPAYLNALNSRVDCIEIDVSRSSDGVLFALHDRDLQRLSGNHTSRVGHFSMNEIKQMATTNEQRALTVEDALMLVSKSVKQVILDVKVGPPSFEEGLADNILDIVNRAQCINCIIWAKSDTLVKDIIRISSNFMVGYIVMKDPLTGARSNLLRIRKAEVVGVYYPLIDENLVQIIHGRKKKVYAWTVDDVSSMENMLWEHVDGIVTSYPTRLQRVMQDSRTQCAEEGSP